MMPLLCCRGRARCSRTERRPLKSVASVLKWTSRQALRIADPTAAEEIAAQQLDPMAR